MSDSTTNAIYIAPLRISDYARWLTLWNGYLTFYKTSLPLTTSDNTWQKLMSDDVPIYGFGAYRSGGSKSDDSRSELVGFVHNVLHPNTWNDTHVCYLEDLFVSESVRGTGAGRALIEHVYQFATHKNCNRVYWTTNEDNAVARKLYDSLANMTDMVQYRHDLWVMNSHNNV